MVGLLDALGEPTGGDRRPRLGRAGGLARGAAAPRPLPRGDRAERAVPAARLDAPDHRRCRRPTTRSSTSSTSRTPGVAEAELERDVRATIRRILYSGSGDASRGRARASWAIPRRSAWCRARGGFLEPHRRVQRPAAVAHRGGRRLLRRASSPARAFAAASTGTATSTATGSCWRRSRARASPSPRSTSRATATWWCAFRGMDQLIPNLSKFVPAAPADDHAARLRALDAAGAPGRGQRGDDRVPAGLVAAARSGGASAGATSSANRRIDRSARSVRSPGRAITRSTRS